MDFIYCRGSLPNFIFNGVRHSIYLDNLSYKVNRSELSSSWLPRVELSFRKMFDSLNYLYLPSRPT